MNLFIKTIIPTLVGMALLYTPFLWCRRRHENPDEYGLSWKFSGRGTAEVLIVTALLLAPLTVLSMRWPLEDLPRQSAFGRTLNLAAAGLAAAIIEEVFFRGWVQPLLRRHLRAWGAVALTSALFAASHIFVAQSPFLLAVFVPGCVMGFLRERHGNISTSTLFHALGNLWAIWFAPLVWPDWREIGQFLEALLS